MLLESISNNLILYDSLFLNYQIVVIVSYRFILGPFFSLFSGSSDKHGCIIHDRYSYVNIFVIFYVTFLSVLFLSSFS